jgi:hypothetical protein
VWQWEAPAKDEALIAKVVALADDKLRAAYRSATSKPVPKPAVKPMPL